MTTLFPFQPTLQAAFQFQPTLDGQTYNVIVTWNLFGQRYYINVYSLDGTLVLCVPLVGSPTGLALESLSWARGTVSATTSGPHGYKVGNIIRLTISNCAPNAYNGIFDVIITGPTTFTYALAANPGPATVLGRADYNIDLSAGFFTTSTLVYREASTQFEVNP